VHVLTVAYGHPADPEAFDRHYQSVHRPLVEQVPGLVSFTARHCSSLDDTAPPYYLIAELAFASAQELTDGRASPQGRAAGADVANFADGGATMFVQHD
jgi:uncharacterized protein (TIGR02118 family)